MTCAMTSRDDAVRSPSQLLKSAVQRCHCETVISISASQTTHSQVSDASA